jgi:hypothetical protein
VNFSLLDVVLILVLAAGSGWVMNGLRVRELAFQAARQACSRQGAQLLDQSVSSKRMSLSRDTGGQWRIWREYHFEYTYDGNQRKSGHVIMLGGRLQALVMAEAEQSLH